MTNLILLNLGYFLVFLALAIREILWLRITITAGQSTPTTMTKLDSILTLDMAGKFPR